MSIFAVISFWFISIPSFSSILLAVNLFGLVILFLISSNISSGLKSPHTTITMFDVV